MDTQKNVEKSDVALREEEILAFWKAHDIFNKTVETPAGKKPEGDFVFYDGPPFATGTPHYGHILAGSIKDAIPRFWTMNGKRVVRKWGWDCHGLPLENIIEKRLGLATKRDIEAMGVKQFNETAREAVLEYADDWKRVIPRMGRFVDMDDDYRTMDPSYTESVWWVFSELNKKGLVYEGFKSMHLCPRCGTTLSNFEVNQGYKDIKDIAVTVKLPLLDDAGNVTGTSLLVWTTTPWTLPGNMAGAVHKDIEYVKVRVKLDEKEEQVILAKARLIQLGTDEYEIVDEMKGSDLVGTSYVPPFDSFTKQDFENKENAWKIWHADYVEIGEEGTGAVHIAPAFGEEDMELAKAHSIPILHHVDENGRFKDFVENFAGQLVKPKDDEVSGVSHLDSDIEMVKRLKEAGLLLRKENITHSYPHCWRCDTPLLNYATTSWFVRVTDIKDKLVAENNKIKWVPDHVGTSRFGKWLEGARDWAVSRQRYWGAPLPIWRKAGSSEYKIFGSKEDLLKYVPRSGNVYHLMRHGEAHSNANGVPSTDINEANAMTERGVEQVTSKFDELKKAHIDLIISSPFERTKETAEMVAESLGINTGDIVYDDRIGEIQVGEFNGKPIATYHEFLGEGISWCDQKPEGAESWNDVKRRAGAFLYDIDSKYSEKNILIVSHNSPLRMFGAINDGISLNGSAFDHDEDGKRYDNAEVRTLEFVQLPHNDNYELDFHRPYIDDITLVDEDGTKLTRVPDVFDCWFESGSMPYGQRHYPFENKDTFLKEKYPANFIAEGLDQTRGWFYSLLVLGTALFGKSPYQHVVVNGLVLAEDGKKMSKSLQNYPDPMELTDKVGADAIRLYLLSSPIVKGEDFNFVEKDVLDIQRKNIGRLHNVLAMYEMFEDGNGIGSDTSGHVLDRWMIARLSQTATEITEGYKNYELDKATRPISDLIDDISVWYLRRSRDRLKGGDEADKHACLATLNHTLKTLSLLMAPVMPFYAEYLFQRVRGDSDAESVHLMAWPKSDRADVAVLEAMKITREVVTKALEARMKENIKVRQPLQTLFVGHDLGKEAEAYHEVIKDEINVKELQTDTTLGAEVRLDTSITPELQQEGNINELKRAIQDARKESGLKPEDRIVLTVAQDTYAMIGEYASEIQHIVGATTISIGDTDRSLTIEGKEFGFKIEV